MNVNTNQNLEYVLNIFICEKNEDNYTTSYVCKKKYLIPISIISYIELIRDSIEICYSSHDQSIINIPIYIPKEWKTNIPEYNEERIFEIFEEIIRFCKYHITANIDYVYFEDNLVNFNEQFIEFDVRFTDNIPIHEIFYFIKEATRTTITENKGIFMKIVDYLNIPSLIHLLGYKYLDYIMRMSREEKRKYHCLPIEFPTLL
jgi:hypothetical protein